METITILATIPAILALTNLAKSLGLAGRWSALLAVLLGVGLNVADWALAGQGWYAAAADGLILGLSAAGLYDLAQTVGNPVVSAEASGGPYDFDDAVAFDADPEEADDKDDEDKSVEPVDDPV